MEHTRQLMEEDSTGNLRRIRCTGMEYTHAQMEQCIMEKTNRRREMVLVVTGIQMAINTMESTRMIRKMERQSLKRVTNYSESTAIMKIL